MLCGQIQIDRVPILKNEVCRVAAMSRSRAGKIDKIHFAGLRNGRKIEDLAESYATVIRVKKR